MFKLFRQRMPKVRSIVAHSKLFLKQPVECINLQVQSLTKNHLAALIAPSFCRRGRADD